ncbi:Hypothetical protein NTJ_14625 [Nesidiocoris tenuis]|uniref:Transmembrane protein n=1 Tax=Nesidiocoris tenuis TaxID=355587 RepID=A0ABN7BF62_9HEMI|nr:Hypothetical protein NTJ_14625 [Nesidiocoris tenuis]
MGFWDWFTVGVIAVVTVVAVVVAPFPAVIIAGVSAVAEVTKTAIQNELMERLSPPPPPPPPPTTTEPLPILTYDEPEDDPETRQTLSYFLDSLYVNSYMFRHCLSKKIKSKGTKFSCRSVLDSETVRNFTAAYFCPKKEEEKCVLVKHTRDGHTLRQFIDWWTFEDDGDDQWVFCDKSGSNCGKLTRAFASNSTEGIIQIKGKKSSAVHVRLIDRLPICYEPTTAAAENARFASGEEIQQQQGIWAIQVSLALLLSMTFVCLAINSAMTFWQIVIFVRKGSFEKWLRWQVPCIFICSSLTFVMFVMSVAENLLGDDLWYVQWVMSGSLAYTSLAMIVSFCVVKFKTKAGQKSNAEIKTGKR